MTRIGVLGGGQLGRMLALAGLPLGLRFRFLEPAAESPAGQVAERIVGSFDDPDCLHGFAEGLGLVTYEFENVPIGAARLLAERVPVYPPPAALEVSQDRLSEKELFTRLSIPTTRYVAAGSQAELEQALGELGCPAVLKTRRLGYDGKGQAVLRGPEDLDRAWRGLGGRGGATPPLLLEEFIPFDRELSQISVRRPRRVHRVLPASGESPRAWHLALVAGAGARRVAGIASGGERLRSFDILRELDYVGVLAVVFFQRGDGLIANETAPCVHNSGHWTIEGAETSQFENHLLLLSAGRSARRRRSAAVPC